jgi:hypothetical protein
MRSLRPFAFIISLVATLGSHVSGETARYLLEVPDYQWYAGCFATTSGNAMGFWDRHGFPDFYTGPTAGGVAPLDSQGTNGEIRGFYASKAGMDGRPANKPGHIDDYWFYYTGYYTDFSYESTEPDPFRVASRAEHTPDCLADFIGLSQRKWTNMNNECDGNIDAYAFVFWDTNGNRRTNYTPPPIGGIPVRDIPSGLREWTRWRGYDADVFSQLADFNPYCPPGRGFTFNDMKAEIDAGYPVLLFMQPTNQFSRSLSNMPKGNPQIHAVLIYGYYIADDGKKYLYNRTSWGDSDTFGFIIDEWGPQNWTAFTIPVRGVIGYHPKPKIRKITRTNNTFTISWDGPSAQLYDVVTDQTTTVHRYVLERSAGVGQPFFAVTTPSTNRFATIAECCGALAFYRVRLSP